LEGVVGRHEVMFADEVLFEGETVKIGEVPPVPNPVASERTATNLYMYISV